MDLLKLAEPFPEGDLEWRIQSAGKGNNGIWARCVPYISNRAIMQRLDDVCGPGNWRNDYREWPGGQLCGLSILVEREAGVSAWVTKWDGATNPEAKQDGGSDMELKGGLSAAMKRAAVQWGIGRYLYAVDETWARVHPDGRFRGKLAPKAGGDSYRWDPPSMKPRQVQQHAERGRPPAAGAGILTHINAMRRKIPDGLVTEVDGVSVELRSWIAERWDDIKADEPLARMVEKVLEREIPK